MTLHFKISVQSKTNFHREEIIPLEETAIHCIHFYATFRFDPADKIPPPPSLFTLLPPSNTNRIFHSSENRVKTLSSLPPICVNYIIIRRYCSSM